MKKTKTARQKTRTTGSTELMRAGRQKRSTSISTACTGACWLSQKSAKQGRWNRIPVSQHRRTERRAVHPCPGARALHPTLPPHQQLVCHPRVYIGGPAVRIRIAAAGVGVSRGQGHGVSAR